MSDSLVDLPYPQAKVEYSEEEEAVHSIFHPTTGSGKLSAPKDLKYVVALVTILFFILSTSYADTFIKKIPYCTSELTCLVAKTFIFLTIFTGVYVFIL
jgi:hypothetical protein